MTERELEPETPMNEQHIKLFNLVYGESPTTNVSELAGILGVTSDAVLRELEELDAYLLLKLGKITPDRLLFVCPNCLDTRIYEDADSGERHCTNEKCGFVIPDSMAQDTSLPFGDGGWSPTSPLAVGKSLGDTLTAENQGLLQREGCRMRGKFLAVFQAEHPELAGRLLNGENGNPPDPYVFDADHAYRLRVDKKGNSIAEQTPLKDFRSVANVAFDTLKFRVQKTRLLTGMEDPKLNRLLKMTEHFCNKLGVDGEQRDNTFKHFLGQNVRRAYWLMQAVGIRVIESRFVDTVLYVTLNQCVGRLHLATRLERNVDRTLEELLLKFNKIVSEFKKGKVVVRQQALVIRHTPMVALHAAQ